ncbi:MAG: sugar porter family MFS transporter [Balneolaceae bacterium]
MNNKRLIYLVFTAFVAALGGLLFGFDMAVISGAIPFVKEQFSLSPAAEGWFVSSALIGAILGVALSGELSDRRGRKKSLLLAAVMFFTSAVGCALAPSFMILILARILGGMAVGIASNVVPLYLSEISPADIRGRLVTCYQLAVTIGILTAYLSNWSLLALFPAEQANINRSLFSSVFGDQIWRAMFSLEVIPAVLFFIGLFFVPDSPRWLLKQGRDDEGREILIKINGEAEAQKQIKDIHRTLDQEEGSYKELLAPGMRIALLIGILLPLFSQFSGINAIIYYGPRILNDAGLSIDDALASQIIMGVAIVLFTFIAIWKVDQMGRRKLYLIGTAGATVSLFLTGLCFYMDVNAGLLLLISALSFLAFFSFSIGPLKFVIASEIFPNKIRGRALGISILTMWASDAIVGQLMPVSLAGLGTAGTFWIFAGFCFVAFWVIYGLVPETKGKTLEEIQFMWSRS